MGQHGARHAAPAKVAYANRDIQLAQEDRQQDDEVDKLYARAFTQIMYHMAGSG